VIQPVRPAALEHTDLVYVLRDLGIPIGHPDTALPVLLEYSLRRHQGVVAGAHRSNHLAERCRHGLSAELRQLRLRIEQVDVARAAFEKGPNDCLCRRLVVGRLGTQRIVDRRGTQLRRQAITFQQ
jgi:hypothetical protein